MTVYRKNPLLMTVCGANPGRRVQTRRRNPSLGASLAGGLAGAFVTHAMSNPGPSFVVIDSRTGLVVYTKRATGVGSEAIAACYAKAKALADRTGQGYITYLDIMGIKVGMRVNVGMVRTLGITDEIPPRLGHGERPNPLTEMEHRQLIRQARHDRGVADVYAERGERGLAGIYQGRSDRGREIAHNYSPRENPAYRARYFSPEMESREEIIRARRTREAMQIATRRAEGLPPQFTRPHSSIEVDPVDDVRRHYGYAENPGRRVVARWEAKGGKRWIELYQDSHGYGYDSDNGGGYLGNLGSDENAIARMEHLSYGSAASLKADFPSTRRTLNPQSNPGPRGRRKITMTVQQFATWVKKKRDPAMWRAFLAKFRGYEKWTHGAKSRKVTLEWQNVPGMDGLWITYDGGKQPESTYIMPKGSPRKGAWKHPWDTMPDIKHDPEAGLVLNKLRGKSRITDFYHK